MHFVTGGAFQGKRKWVCREYNLKSHDNYRWHSFYETSEMIQPEELHSEKLVIFEGLEENIKGAILLREINSREQWANVFQRWKTWEMEKQDRMVIFIGCDISKGIVPLDKNDRDWRDVTGWCYQELTSECSRVDIIWNGLAQTIKREEGDTL